MAETAKEPVGPEPPAWPLVSFLIFLIWIAFMSTAATALVLWLLYKDVPGSLVIALLVLMGALGLSTLRARPEPAGDQTLWRLCGACGIAAYPTRNSEGLRLWTCFRCGREAPRRRTTRELYYPTVRGGVHRDPWAGG